MSDILKIYKKISKQNSKIYSLKSTTLILFFFSKVSYLISPFFIIFKIEPNKITYLNLILSAILICFIFNGTNSLVAWAILIYFFCIIIDFCDGSVARYSRSTSFYGRFIDGLVDIFQKTFLILSLSFYGFKFFNDLNLLILGCVASLLSSFDTFILDRYSALIRWFNLKYNKNSPPYIWKKVLVRWSLIYNDVFMILIGLIYISKDYQIFLYYNLIFLFTVCIVSAIQSLLIHTYFAFKNLKIKGKR